MRFRFSATTRDGDTRSGFLEAEDEAAAHRQLERRGMAVQSLVEDQVELPTFIRADPTGPSLPPLSAKPPQPRRLEVWLAFLKALDWRRVAPVLVLAMVVLGAVGWGLNRALADPTYHLVLTGEFHIKTRKKLPPTYWKRIYPRLWLPKQRWFVMHTGTVYAKASDGKWKSIARKAQVKYEANVEGNYRIDVEIALPSPPEGCALDFSSRNCARAGKRAMFKIKNNVFVCEVPDILLVPHKKEDGKESASKSKPKPTKKRRRPRRRQPRQTRHRQT